MKNNIRILFVSFLFAFSFTSFSQTNNANTKKPVGVGLFKEGRKISKSDIAFLHFVNNDTTLEISKKQIVSLNGKDVSLNNLISKELAEHINQVVDLFKKNNPSKGKMEQSAKAKSAMYYCPCGCCCLWWDRWGNSWYDCCRCY